jgi:hypothetical protein
MKGENNINSEEITKWGFSLLRFLIKYCQGCRMRIVGRVGFGKCVICGLDICRHPPRNLKSNT